MIFVCGISFSGKTHTIAAFVANHEYSHVKASAILAEIGRPIRSLTFSDAEENQRILFEYLDAKKLISPTTILDGHVIIETVEGIFPIPDWFFVRTQISKIVCITDSPEVIQRRRRSQAPSLIVDAATLQELQEVELTLATKQANRLGIHFRRVAAGHIEEFGAVVLDHQ